MLLFMLGVAVLVVGYLVYGKIIEKVYQPTDDPTPAITMADGVDFVQLPLWRIVVIQFLNIAGLGPIYGAIAGALFGPSAFLWIAFGCIFAGAVHDFTVGILSMRNSGATVGELVGKYLGRIPQQVMRVLSVILVLLVGVVFTKGPAGVFINLLETTGKIVPSWLNTTTLFYVILCYYILGTFLPVDKIIGRIYPWLGAILIVTGILLGATVMIKGYSIPFEGFGNVHPAGDPIFPFLFVTIACGAVSGFHATVSPVMARCVSSEKQARTAFYGAMVCEGILAMVWASVPMAFYHHMAVQSGAVADAAAVSQLMLEHGALNNPGQVVNEVSLGLLGAFGGFLAVIGVIVCPITTGEASFRTVRLQLGDMLHMPQNSASNRLKILLPVLAVAILLNYVDFGILWRYFAFTNQLLAAFALWMGTGYFAYIKQVNKHWFTSVPAAFMTSVCVCYICTAKIGLNIPYEISKWIGIVAGIASLVLAHTLVVRCGKKEIVSAEA